jgi:hypothetical protein
MPVLNQVAVGPPNEKQIYFGEQDLDSFPRGKGLADCKINIVIGW